ncbi:hypothetical protein [Clostridium sp.]|nr:hypothetical protein [Clostridium sp.]
MNIKKTSKLIITLVAGVTLVKTLMADKLNKEVLDKKEEEIKKN